MYLVIHAWRDLRHPQAGGSERLVDQLASGMTQRGHRVHLICGGPVGKRAYEVTDAGGTYSQYARVPWLDRDLTRDADVVLDVANGATYCTPLWRRQPTILLVHHMHRQQWHQTFPFPIAAAGSFFERRVVPAIYRHCLVIAVSPSTARDLRSIGIDDSRIRIVPNAVDLTTGAVSSGRSDEPLFVALGRLVPHKRIDLLLDMWARVRPATGGRLVVMGDGPELQSLRDRADAVELLGRVDDETKQRLLAQAWLLVHAASHEGWGIAITEAAVQRTPALAFDVAGVRDAVIDRQTGRLAADTDEFVRLWIEMAQDCDQLAQYGTAARDQASMLDARSTVDRFEEVAMEAIERRPRRRSRRRPS